MSYCRLIPFMLLVAVLAACEHGDAVVDGDGDDLQPTLQSIQANVFNTSCALSNCHTGPNAPQGLDLSAGSARANLIKVPSTQAPDFLRVEPGNADDSYLVMKLEGDSRISGARMPFQRPALSSNQLSVIRAWIDSGAP